MSVTIISSVPIRGSHSSSLTSGSLTINNPSASSPTVSISQVSGLQAALDAKLTDTAGALGATTITASGNDINLLAGISTYGLVANDLKKLADINTATAAELDFMAGVTSSVQTQLDSKLAHDGSIAMTGALDLNGNAIKLSPDGLTTIDSTTDGIISIKIGNVAMYRIDSTGLNLAIDSTNRKISGVLDPVNAQDAATKNYIDTTFLPLAGGNMTGALDMGAKTLSNVSAPTAGTHIGDRAYNDARYAQLANNLSDIPNKTTARSNLGLATVASTGNYTDLLGQPTLVQNLNDLLDVNVANAGTATNGYVVGWNNTNSKFELLASSVNSVFGRTGAVVAANGDYTAAQITNVAAGKIVATTVQAAIDELDTEKLAIDGSMAMTGSFNAGNNPIINVTGPFTVDNNSLKSTGIISLLGGNSYSVSNSATPSAAAPTYSFASNANTGMWWDGSKISLSVLGNNKLMVSATDIDVNNLPVKNVATPTLAGDAVNKGYIDGLIVQRVLGSTTGINMAATGSTTIYTVPTGKSQIITQVIIVATSYVAGATPVDPIISMGSGASTSNVMASKTVSWGAGGAADQAVYLTPVNGSATPNSANAVSFTVNTAAGGTFTALVADVYVIGFEM